tara:strand:+ start:1331 stop:1507 length:177 start_codon:yes stop_codon:yes gene_type:complete
LFEKLLISGAVYRRLPVDAKIHFGANTFSNQDARDIYQRLDQMVNLKTKKSLSQNFAS